MAKNTGDDYRKGSVDDRIQIKIPGGSFMKRDTDTGRFMDQKEGGKQFKGVAKEKTLAAHKWVVHHLLRSASRVGSGRRLNGLAASFLVHSRGHSRCAA